MIKKKNSRYIVTYFTTFKNNFCWFTIVFLAALLIGCCAVFILLLFSEKACLIQEEPKQPCSINAIDEHSLLSIWSLSNGTTDIPVLINDSYVDTTYSVDVAVNDSFVPKFNNTKRKKRSAVPDITERAALCSEMLDNITRRFSSIDRKLKRFEKLLESFSKHNATSDRGQSYSSESVQSAESSAVNKTEEVTVQSGTVGGTFSDDDNDDNDDNDDDEDGNGYNEEDINDNHQHTTESNSDRREKTTGERLGRDVNLTMKKSDGNSEGQNDQKRDGWQRYCFLIKYRQNDTIRSENNHQSDQYLFPSLTHNVDGIKQNKATSTDVNNFSAFSLSDVQRKKSFPENSHKASRLPVSVLLNSYVFSNANIRPVHGSISQLKPDDKLTDVLGRLISAKDSADFSANDVTIQFYCTYLPIYLFTNASIVFTSNRTGVDMTGKRVDISKVAKELKNNRSFNNEVDQTNFLEDLPNCNDDEKLCGDMKSCISSLHWCDGIVHCSDSSDEIRCSCKERIDENKLCDGYFDCPNGEDERGCFGCSEDAFSCEDWFPWKPRTSCVPMNKRCDNIKDCINGRDEKDCILLASEILDKQLFLVSYDSGILHRNWKGHWYPVCLSKSSQLPSTACQKEIGAGSREVETKLISLPVQYGGNFILDVPNKEPQLTSYCHEKNHAVYVSCPDVPCGSRQSTEYDNMENNKYRLKRGSCSNRNYLEQTSHSNSTVQNSKVYQFDDTKLLLKLLAHLLKGKNISSNIDSSNRSKRYDDKLLKLNYNNSSSGLNKMNVSNNDNETITEEARVVGGEPSRPGHWPWIIALYKNGIFHCGGVILNRNWIMTAAHCVHGFHDNYYEIQAGLLRRLSFSPTEQTRAVSRIIVHNSYRKSDMINDLALMHLENPLIYNRWVRPICLPEAKFPWGPLPGSMCTAVGWGATVEHGSDPDNVREVQVPILPHCKHASDEIGDEICAGFINGGHDTCQGDSGGPLLCRIPTSPENWYVAGIVSHGEGCARPMEPGAYTRVALYISWILENTDESALGENNLPLLTCPGLKCHKDGRCISSTRVCDKVVDCLNAEDELNCSLNSPSFKSNEDERSKLIYNVSEQSSNVTLSNVTGNYNGTKNDGNQDIDIKMLPVKTTSEIELSVKPITDATSINHNYSDSNHSSLLLSYLDKLVENASMNAYATLQSNINYDLKDARRNETAFTCTQIFQTIPYELRCDGFVQCEDGSDELNCTCVDRLRAKNSSAVCDAYIDCYDSSDEVNCFPNGNCLENEFFCPKSKLCIEKQYRCDDHKNCKFGEDEDNCLALTNGVIVEEDVLGSPINSWRGIITYNKKSEWKPLCVQDIIEGNVALNICQTMGYYGYDSYEKILVRNQSLPIVKIESNSVCTGINISCSAAKHVSDSESLPWHIDLYKNGIKTCPAILLTSNWIIGSYRCCQYLGNSSDYLVAVLGISHYGTDTIKSPHEQTIRIDNITCSVYNDFFLAHLSEANNNSAYVRPIGIPNMISKLEKSHVCLAIGYDQNNGTTVIQLYPRSGCSTGYKCFTVHNKKVLCSNYDRMFTFANGAICSLENDWYLAAVFNNETDTFCTDHNVDVLKLKMFENSIEHVSTIVGLYKSSSFIEIDIVTTHNETVCDGIRCSLGNCIPWTAICDGKQDCRDGEDELLNNCLNKHSICGNKSHLCGCRTNEILCGNGKCVHKSLICDGQNDCGDETDEPFSCADFNCMTYLNLTAPDRICDSKVDCADKTDEKITLCSPSCKSSESTNFMCHLSDLCIPNEFVCDGERDCPNGEDEADCLSLKSISGKKNEGFLMIRTQGEWDLECISADFTTNSMNTICSQLGFKTNRYIQYIPSKKRSPKLYSTARINSKIEVILKVDQKVPYSDEPCNQIYLICG